MLTGCCRQKLYLHVIHDSRQLLHHASTPSHLGVSYLPSIPNPLLSLHLLLRFLLACAVLKQYSPHTSITMSSRRYDSRVSSTPMPSHLLAPQAAHANIFHHRRPSSRRKVVSTRSSMPSKPSPSPAQLLAFSPKMASSSPPNAKSQASY
jgi:hypothetical protein